MLYNKIKVKLANLKESSSFLKLFIITIGFVSANLLVSGQNILSLDDALKIALENKGREQSQEPWLSQKLNSDTEEKVTIFFNKLNRLKNKSKRP